MRALEPGGIGDEHGDHTVPARLGALPHLLLPRGVPVRRQGHEQAAVRGGGGGVRASRATAGDGEVGGDVEVEAAGEEGWGGR